MITIVLAVIILILSSFFFGFQSMPRLYKLSPTGKKIFWGFLIFFLVAPCFILLFYYIIKSYVYHPWIAGPCLVLFILWLATGFLSKIAYKTLTETNPKRKRKPFTMAVIKKRYRFSALFLALAAAIWIFGLTIGFGNYDSAFLILFFYFIVQGIAFILGNRKAIADGNIEEPRCSQTEEESPTAEADSSATSTRKEAVTSEDKTSQEDAHTEAAAETEKQS